MKNTIVQGDCIEVLKTIPSESVDCCVTSPPYFGLRDYGHAGQIGLEETPELFIAKMVEVFTEVKRVLKKEGTLWLNIGDSYWGGKGQSGSRGAEIQGERHLNGNSLNTDYQTLGGAKQTRPTDRKHDVIKPKDLIGIPWMLAFALRADGWYLRQDIIWAKKNCMPESVNDRCTKSHEYIFLLSKSAKYYYDSDAIMEPIAASTANDKRLANETFSENRPERGYAGSPQQGSGMLKPKGNRKTFRGGGKYTQGQSFDNSTLVKNDSIGNSPNETSLRNKRSVWHVATTPYPEAHFATFPEDLIIDCIKAGCPADGIVLDPFMGAGTTALVSRKLDRNFIGIELNQKYIDIANKRLRDHLGMFL